MAVSVFDNPIGWAQFKLLGGWKNIAMTAGCYLAIAVAVIVAMIRAIDVPATTIFSNFVSFFLAIQVVVVLLFGTQRVGAAVRADVNAKLLESHRLMPVPPATAVLGYLFGSTIQALSFFLVTVILGGVCVVGAKLRLQSWLFSNLILLVFAVLVWTVIMFFSFRSGGSAIGIVLAMVFMALSRGTPMFMMPALNILVSPMIGNTIFDMRTGMTIERPSFLRSSFRSCSLRFILRPPVGATWRDDAIGFDSGLGLILLFIWTTICVVLTSGSRTFSLCAWGFYYREYQETSFISSISVVMLMAILPISSRRAGEPCIRHQKSSMDGCMRRRGWQCLLPRPSVRA